MGCLLLIAGWVLLVGSPVSIPVDPHMLGLGLIFLGFAWPVEHKGAK